MNKQILQKVSIFLVTLGGTIYLTSAFESGKTRDYIYAALFLLIGLLTVFTKVEK